LVYPAGQSKVVARLMLRLSSGEYLLHLYVERNRFICESGRFTIDDFKNRYNKMKRP
jgi:hypothetical protein